MSIPGKMLSPAFQVLEVTSPSETVGIDASVQVAAEARGLPGLEVVVSAKFGSGSDKCCAIFGMDFVCHEIPGQVNLQTVRNLALHPSSVDSDSWRPELLMKASTQELDPD